MRGRSSTRAQPSHHEHIANDDLADLAELYRVLGRATVRVLCGHQAAADGAGRAGGDQGGSRLTPAQAQALQTALRRSAQF